MRLSSVQMSSVMAAAAALVVMTATTSAIAAPKKATGVTLMASLSGPVEVPPGDPDGMGAFNARLNVGQGQLCYTLTSSKIAAPTMAHIHAGEAGKAGPPVVTLQANAPKQTCMTIDKAVAQKLVASPGDYYVNIHTADHPGGAIRGQLMKH